MISVQTDNFRYDAFISYRHNPADKAAAVRLQQLLERHKHSDGTPLRIFRDQSELPTSSDLGADIYHALEQSRFLIVVGSPEYGQSKWCMAELEHFRNLQGDTNKNILPLLVSGEPDQAFPELLHWETRQVTLPDGTVQLVRQEVEPLGADIRADSVQKQRKLLQTEYLRIAAPILGCRFDDLYQRSQRRRRNQFLAAASAVAVLATAFSVYSLYMLDQIQTRQQLLEQKQTELYVNESRRLGDEALALMDEYPNLALLLADAALPEDLEEPEYPIQPEAELALRNAVIRQQLQETGSAMRLLAKLPSGGEFSKDGSVYLVNEGSHSSLYDAKQGNLISQAEQGIRLSWDGSRYLQTRSDSLPDGRFQVTGWLCDSRTGEMLGEQVVFYRGNVISYSVRLDQETDRMYIISTQNELGYGFFDAEGNYTFLDGKPEHLISDPDEVSYTWFEGSDVGDGMDRIIAHQGWPEICEAFRACVGEKYIINTFTALSSHQIAPLVFPHAEMTYDGRLCFIHCAEHADYLPWGTEPEKDMVAVWAVKEQKLIALLNGRAFPVADNGYFYCQQDGALQVYRYYPEKLGDLPREQEAHLELLSADGSRVLMRETDQNGQKVLRVYETADLNEPILELPYERSVMDATKDLRYVLLKQGYEEEKLLLYDVDSGKLLWSCPVDGGDYFLDETGSRIAGIMEVAFDKDAMTYTWQIQVLDLQSEKLLLPKELEVSEEIRAYGWPYLEFDGDRLLVAFTGKTWIYDLARPDQVQSMENLLMMRSARTYAALQTQMVQPGNLLIVPGSLSRGELTPVAIHDLETGQQVSWQTLAQLDFEGYCYDAASETLVLEYGNIFSVQRRGSDGNFHEVFQLQAQDSGAEISPWLSPTDGTYLVINGRELCEVYRIEDGSLVCTIPQSRVHEAYYAVRDGVLYDLNGVLEESGTMPAYRIPDTADAREAARQLLCSDEGSRVLTASECDNYYIPNEWRPE